jgi:type IV pilus biogenesis protein CpaD/CtpE
MRTKLIFAILLTLLLVGCAEEQKDLTGVIEGTQETQQQMIEEEEVSVLEDNISEIDSLINELQELEEISFEI